jgi:hypothetical protein
MSRRDLLRKHSSEWLTPTTATLCCFDHRSHGNDGLFVEVLLFACDRLPNKAMEATCEDARA